MDTEYAPCVCTPMGKMKRVSQPYKPGNPMTGRTDPLQLRPETWFTVSDIEASRAS